MMDDYLWLAPGSNFADKVFTIGCPPPFHFMWAALYGPTIKHEVKETLANNHVTGITFHEVDIAFVGKGEPYEIPFLHTFPYIEPSEVLGYFLSTGKLNEDDLKHDVEVTPVEPRDNPQSYGPLYYMRVSHSGPDWRDWKAPPTCTYCGCREFPQKPEGLVFGREHILDGHDIFLSGIVPGIVVSEKVHDIIMDHKFTNCHLRELPLS